MDFTWSGKNTVENLHKLREEIEAIYETWQMPMCTVFTLQLTVDELITNIVMHAQQGSTIWLHISRNEQTTLVQIKDDAHSFNPLQHEDPDTEANIEDREIGGLGIFLIKEKSETFTYTRENNCNILNIKLIDRPNK